MMYAEKDTKTTEVPYKTLQCVFPLGLTVLI